MSKATSARKLAAAAAYGGGGLTLFGGGIWALLVAEAKFARKMIGVISDPVPDCTGWYGRNRPGPAIKIALLGDSSAAGYGVKRVEETPGAVLAASVAEQANRRVFIRELCEVGAQSSALNRQIVQAKTMKPDVAIIFIGGNDVTHSVLPAQSIRYLTQAIKALRKQGAQVVVGTCPDLGTVRPIPQPLRYLARVWSRRLAAAQTIATISNGGFSVSLADVLGAEFSTNPAMLFGPDKFHPSVAGYARLAQVMVPTVLAAIRADDQQELAHGDRVMSITRAAVKASKQGGTELGRVKVAGRSHGKAGRWVAIRNRKQVPLPAPSKPEAEEINVLG